MKFNKSMPHQTILRPYQEDGINICLEKLKKGIKRQIVELPVGSGKTVFFSHLISRIPVPKKNATKVLILAHRDELLQQARLKIFESNNNITVSIDQGKAHALLSSDVIIASVATLGRNNSKRLEIYNKDDFKCIVIDEAHHAAANSYLRILNHFSALDPDSHIFVFGCSATVRRHDGRKLGDIFEDISYQKQFLEMIDEKWLCGIRATCIKTNVNISSVRTISDGDFSVTELSRKINTPERNKLIVEQVQKHAHSRKSIVVFAVNIEHVECLTQTFCDYGYDARALSSKTRPFVRSELIEDFSTQKFPILVNCGILTEGTDIPVIDCIVMARPTRSDVIFQQMIGRGMRLSKNKTDCLIIDFVDACRKCALITIPTLLGLNINYDSIEVINNIKIYNNNDVNDINKLVDIKVSTKKFDNISQIVDEYDGHCTFRDVSSNAWIYVCNNTCLLPWFDGTKNHIVEISKEDTFTAYYGVKNARMHSYDFVKIPLDTDDTFTILNSIKAVDSYIVEHFGYIRNMQRWAPWRKDCATPGQINFLKNYVKIDNEITKGEASDLITKITFRKQKMKIHMMRNEYYQL